MSNERVHSQHRVPLWLRAGMSALSAIAPEHAARVGADLFGTTRPRRIRPAERACLAQARCTSIGSRGLDLCVYQWGEAPLVFLHHGWNGNAAQMTAFVPGLLERGYGVLALDAAAHGRSEGRRNNLLGMTDDAVTVAQAFTPRIFVGHSMGAVVGVRLVHAGVDLERLVMLAPPAEFEPYFAAFARSVGMSPRAHQLMMRNFRERAGARFEEFTAEWLTRRELPPVLVVYDDDDTDAPPSHARRWIAHWPAGAEAMHTTGLGHRALLREPDVAARVAEFVASG